ncbi:hypothetical protein [Agromyces sp. S2-1-8]|uniref:hypothetical protein n=1 Tax=Agromyces sp. S2-1-8 TaxID=2897180 RepID=UPI001E55F9D2|nr:hypothetical protein [Agromyces sp. S2-1-8]MCD5348106.1 hypothetical protein [Agromyces sp. S2-1-8]
MPVPEHGELWAKAKLFITRALESEGVRDFEERAFWAAAALELLAKAALARVSPLLIIPPDAEGKNVLAALGVVAYDGSPVETVAAKTLWARSERAFRPFAQKEAALISAGRNEYLHGIGTGLPNLPEHVWWGRYWNQASILVVALDQDLHAFVGGVRLEQVERYLQGHTHHVQEHVDSLIARSQQRLAQRGNPAIAAGLRDELIHARDLSAGLLYVETAACPACGGDGVLEGEETGGQEIDWDSDPWSPIETLEVYADHFSCPKCQLVLNRAELIELVDLPVRFTIKRDYEPDEEPDYGND